MPKPRSERPKIRRPKRLWERDREVAWSILPDLDSGYAGSNPAGPILEVEQWMN